MYISTEQNFVGQAGIYKAEKNGVLIAALPLDIKFQPNFNQTSGMYKNLAFESLAVSPNQKFLFSASESSLIQDGSLSSLTEQAYARIIQYDLNTHLARAEYVYPVGLIPTAPDTEKGFSDNGLVELLPLDNSGMFLSLERSFASGAAGTGFSGKIYVIDLSRATNVISNFVLPKKYKAATKELLLDLNTLKIVIDNIEGMTLGPTLTDGRRVLVIVSDDNFNKFVPETTQFIALAFSIDKK